MTSSRAFASIAALSMLCAVPAAGSQEQATRPETKKTMKAIRITSPIRVDGHLDEGSWAAAEPISDFVQQEPRENELATERTEVRVLFDADAIYFGVQCFDSDPSRIIARELRRDNAMSTDDHFEILLDTFHDHRNAFHFMINPLGTQFDQLVTDEGQDVNAEWDERWWSAAVKTETGWAAEIKIPFTILRSRQDIDTYGVNFKRLIRRKNEFVQWTGWDRDYLFLHASQAGHLTGLTGVETGLKLRVKPYALGGFSDPTFGGPSDVKRSSEVGIENLKFSVTPSLTAEVTVNTDFAQAEVDEAIVNLTRFPQFFPEKREFFLERAGIFEFAPGGRKGGATERTLQMFFSRRIGLTPDRIPLPVHAGAKLIGRAAGVDVGLLNVQTGDYQDLEGSNYTVFRAKRNILSRSNFGAFFSNRQASGTDFNRVFGADVNFTFFKNTDIQGFIGRSDTPGRQGDDRVGRAKFNWYTDLNEVFVEHLYVGPEFQHDVGFVRRADVRRSHAAHILQVRPKIPNLKWLVFRNEFVYTTDTHGNIIAREQLFRHATRFQNDDAFLFHTQYLFDRVERPFEIARGITVPAGDYSYRENYIDYSSSPKRKVQGIVRWGKGTFYSGDKTLFLMTPVWRPSPHVSFETSYEFNDVRLREGNFTTHVVNARMNLNLSNRWLTTTLAQYDSASRRNVLYFRLNYIYRPGDDIFFVFNQSHLTGTGSLDEPDRALMIKMTYSLDF